MMLLSRLLAILACLALTIVVILLGLPIVSVLAATRSWKRGKSKLGKDIWVWKYALAWPWGNSEDGIDPALVPTPLTAFKWAALRNPASNLRFTPGLGFQVDPKRVQSVGNNRNLYLPLPNDGKRFYWSYTWHGIYSGLWLVWRGSRQVRVGWTLVPADADEPFNPQNLRLAWCGFSVQFNKSGE